MAIEHMVAESEKIRRSDIHAHIERARSAHALVESKFKRSQKLWRAALATLIIGGIIASIQNPEVIVFLLIFGIFGIIVVYGIMMSTIKKIWTKVDASFNLFSQLMTQLHDEVSPRANIVYSLDLWQPDLNRKLDRTAHSYSGNLKKYFLDKWLRLQVTLADGTNVRITIQRSLKHKKGSFVKNKRRAVLTFWPSSRRYNLGVALTSSNLDTLKKRIKEAVSRSFHDPPEELHVQPRVTDDQGITIRIVQLDAEFFADELLAVIATVIDHFDTRFKREHIRT